jgi:serine/threonine-protein kinase
MSLATVQPQLLLLLLAFQNRFLDRSTLLSAFDAWSDDASRPIRDILLEHTLLSAADLESVELLAARFLQRHAGNASQSLADIAPIDAGMRRALEETVVDQDVRTALTAISCSDDAPPPAEPRAAVAVDIGESTSQGTRFRILRPHARGGLGEVFVAEDSELHREVALKQMQAQHADNERTRARFVLEAEITGGLEHPSIVPVYGLGTYADGRPFYAMRFVRGESFREAIAAYHAASKRTNSAARTLAFRKLLGRFVNICDAIAYAHSRGVLHRDLKPDNVMLGKYGETLVVDWGLAKAIGKRETLATEPHTDEHLLDPISGEEVAETRMGTAIGTPGYLSPEQATGRIDELGAATDIYSLGATLYYLIVNRPPVTGNDLQTVLQRTERGEINPLRQRGARVPRGLQAICLKALATRPQDRYPTARALADDVEQWLADEPVSALREGPLTRLGRWTRKHRALVGSMGAALVMVAAVASAAAVSIERARRKASDLADANGRLATTNKQLADTERKAKVQAVRSAREADQQRTLTLDTLNALVYDVQDQLANRSGMQELKRRLLDTARTNLTKIGEVSDGGSRTVDRLSAAAMVKTGDVFITLGSLDEAGKLYSEAADALETLLAVDASDAMARQVLSVAQNKLGAVLQQQGNLSAARDLFEQSLVQRRRLAEENPGDHDAERDVAISYNCLGEVVRQQGDLGAARTLYEKSVEITATIAANRPGDRQAQRDLAVSYNRLGDIFLRQGDRASAETFFRRDWEITGKLVESDPDDVQVKRDLMIAENGLGDLLMETDPPAARTFYERGLELCQTLADADKNDISTQRDLAIAYHKLGDFAVKTQDWKTAREHFERALPIIVHCAEKDPKSAQAQRDLSVASERLGDVMLRLGDRAASLEYFQQALNTSEQLAAADPANARAQRDLSVTLNKMGDLATQLNFWEGARHFYERSLAIRLRLAEADSANAEGRHDVMVSHSRMATVLCAEKQYTEAEASYRAAIDVLEKMIADGMLVERSKEKRAIIQADLDACQKAAHDSKDTPVPQR